MKVLVACEFSGIVREAFRRRGHDAVSCDILETETPGPHIRRDVLEIIDDGWDLMIAHPPCTYLANSGVRWLHERPGRWTRLDYGAAFFRTLLEAPIERVAIENPIPHKYAIERIGRTYDQLIQPYQFGHHESKATCLWLRNLPPLEPTDDVREATLRLPKKESQRVWYASPGADRGLERSRFYRGIADAMASQWGGLRDGTEGVY